MRPLLRLEDDEGRATVAKAVVSRREFYFKPLDWIAWLGNNLADFANNQPFGNLLCW